MVLTRRHFLMSGAAMAAWPGSALAGPPSRITVVFHDTPDDLWRTTASGTTIGIAPEILEEVVTRRAGLALDYIALPWLRAQEAVRDGSADALFTIPNAARRQFMNFTPSALVSYPMALVYAVDGPHAAALDQADTVEALKSFTYVYNIFDTSQTERAREFSAVAASPGDRSMLREVAGGRGDFTIVNKLRIQAVVEALGLTGRLKVRGFSAFGRIEHHFGIRNGYPDCEAAIERIEAACTTAKAEGAIQAILDRHV
jgi:polar amino acid transport system substrate-binding protein